MFLYLIEWRRRFKKRKKRRYVFEFCDLISSGRIVNDCFCFGIRENFNAI